MNAGQGSISFGNKVSASGSPFAAGSARNGLSVDGLGKIVLGADAGSSLAQLLNDRFIKTNNHSVLFLDDPTQASGRQIGITANQISMINLISFDQAVYSVEAISLNDTGANNFPHVTFVDSTPANSSEIGLRSNDGFFKIARTSGHVIRFQVDMINGGILTTDPGSGAGKWRLGKRIAAAVGLDATHYIEVMIDGTIVKLGIVV